MNDDRDRRGEQTEKEDAKQHFVQGMGLLFRAAREAATGLKKDIDRSGVLKSIDDAGRELTRAATNVVGRIEKEIKKVQPGEPAYVKESDPQDPHPWKRSYEGPPEGRGQQQAPGQKPAGQTPDDPGLRIAVNDPSQDDKPY